MQELGEGIEASANLITDNLLITCNSCSWNAFTERRTGYNWPRGGVSDDGETVVVMMGGVVVVALLVMGGERR